MVTSDQFGALTIEYHTIGIKISWHYLDRSAASTRTRSTPWYQAYITYLCRIATSIAKLRQAPQVEAPDVILSISLNEETRVAKGLHSVLNFQMPPNGTVHGLNACTCVCALRMMLDPYQHHLLGRTSLILTDMSPSKNSHECKWYKEWHLFYEKHEPSANTCILLMRTLYWSRKCKPAFEVLTLAHGWRPGLTRPQRG